jgi:cobalamin biosynthetic protein CobC
MLSNRSNGLPHGGRLRAAAKRYRIALKEWLDLSTGINPNGWPVPPLPATAWNRLPEDDDGLEAAARDYYDTPHVLPVAGSQAAIQALPRLIDAKQVAVLRPSYAEHKHAWSHADRMVTSVSVSELDGAVGSSDVVVLTNPNNPTGALFSRDQLLDWQARLAQRGGWLIVDEAFIDVAPSSLASTLPRPGLVILRSLGKFFGMAGARVGFVCAEPALLQRMKTLLGPWHVAGPSRYAALLALEDRAWQETARSQLKRAGTRLKTLLRRHDLTPQGECDLFQWISTPHAAHLNDQLAQRGILTRYFDDPPSLRIGLPKTEEDWARFDAALGAVVASATFCA